MIMEQVKGIDTAALPEDVPAGAVSEIVEQHRVFIWIRLFLREEPAGIEPGDRVAIRWTPSGETLSTMFKCYGKKGQDKDRADEVVNYNPEDDRRQLCLMVDLKDINLNDSIPFIRTLFKEGAHYEYQLVRRDELTFTLEKTGQRLEYYDCNF